MKPWRTLNYGAFLILVGLDIIAAYGNLYSWDLFLAVIFAAYGVWLLLLALIKWVARPSLYEYPPLMVGGWGILLGGVGFLWIVARLTAGQLTLLGLGIFIVAIGVIVVAYSLVKK